MLSTPATFEEWLNSTSREAIISWMMTSNILKNEQTCPVCNRSMKIRSFNRNKDRIAWRCFTSSCINYLQYFSIRNGSFFENFKGELKLLLKILCRYAGSQQTFSILRTLNVSRSTICKLLKSLIEKMDVPEFSRNKLGGFGKVVQIDETMLNYKCKSHRGRSPTNRSDALVIVEKVQQVTRIFACIIGNKRAETILPIIQNNVAAGSEIHTDEHPSYSALEKLGYVHHTVCHKYEFINRTNNANTQAVESINNQIKVIIKRRMGVITECREKLLKEFCFLFNNKNNIMEKIIEITKIN